MSFSHEIRLNRFCIAPILTEQDSYTRLEDPTDAPQQWCCGRRGNRYDKDAEVQIRKKVHAIDINNSHILLVLFHLWFNPLLELSKYTIHQFDIPKGPDRLNLTYVMPRVFRNWTRLFKRLHPTQTAACKPDPATHFQSGQQPTNSSSQGPTIFWALALSFPSLLFITALMEVSYHSFNVLIPYVIAALTQFLEDSDNGLDVNIFHGLAYALTLSMICFLVASSSTIRSYHYANLGLHNRAAISMAVVQKSLRIAPSSLGPDYTSGTTLNMITNDAQRFFERYISFHTLWSSPVMVIVTSILMVVELGIPALAAVGLMALLFPYQILMARLIRRHKARAIRKTDERVKHVSELIQGVRIIKLYAWEEPMSQRLSQLRAEELWSIRLTLIIKALNESILFIWPLIVTYVTVCLFPLFSDGLNQRKVFMLLAFLSSVRFPISLLPYAISSTVEMNVANARVSTYLNKEELPVRVPAATVARSPLNLASAAHLAITPSEPLSAIASKPLVDPTSPSHHEHFLRGDSTGDDNQQQLFLGTSSPPAVHLQNCDFYWTSLENNPYQYPVLSNISLRIPHGTLCGVIGPVGVGKTALLMGILGELSVYPHTPIDFSDLRSYIVNRIHSHLNTAGDEVNGDHDDFANIAEQDSLNTTPLLADPSRSRQAEHGEQHVEPEDDLRAIYGAYSFTGNTRVIPHHLVAIRGRVGYCAQDPWLLNGTLKENITLGLGDDAFDQERFDRAIAASALSKDIQMLSQGADTPVGDSGISLSGGQRARCAFARLLYRADELDVVFLDDIFAAVDVAVARTMFFRGVCEILADKTVILTLNSHFDFLSHCDTVVSLDYAVHDTENVDSAVPPASSHVPSIRYVGGINADQHIGNEDMDNIHDDDGDDQDSMHHHQEHWPTSHLSSSTMSYDMLSAVMGSRKPAIVNKVGLFSELLQSDINVLSTFDMNRVPTGDDGRSSSGTLRLAIARSNSGRSRSSSLSSPKTPVASGELSSRSVAMSSLPTKSIATDVDSHQQSRDKHDHHSDSQHQSVADDPKSPVHVDLSPGASGSFSGNLPTHTAPSLLPSEKPSEQPCEKPIVLTGFIEQATVKGKYFVSYIRGSKGPSMTFVTVLAILCTACGAQFFRMASDYWITRWAKDSPFHPAVSLYTEYYWRVSTGCLMALCLVYLLIRTFVLNSVYMNASQHLHDTTFNAVMKAPMAWFDTTLVGNILNRFGKDMDQIDSILPDNFDKFVQNILVLVGVTTLACISSYYFLFALVPLFYALHYFRTSFARTSLQLKRLENSSMSPVYSSFQTILNGAQTIRAYNLQDYFLKIHLQLVDKNTHIQALFTYLQRRLAFILNVIAAAFVLIIASLVIVFRHSVNTQVSLLAITLSMQLIGLLQGTVRIHAVLESSMTSVERLDEYAQIPQEGSYVTSHNAVAKNILPVLPSLPSTHVNTSEPGTTTTSPVAQRLHGWPWRGEVVFDRVCMSYRPELPLVLNNLSITIPSGKKVGVIGRTGAGKSSLLLALFRMVELSSGRITIDGVDISQLGLGDLRSRLSIITQQPTLFSGTVRSNLDPFHLYDDDTIDSALKYAHIYDKVHSMPQGLHSLVGEGGGNFSQAERQLLCIARSLLLNNKIIVLDEATASVDPAADEAIQHTIRSAFNDCTILTIAHRLETIADFDYVMVLQPVSSSHDDDDSDGDRLVDHPPNTSAQQDSLLEFDTPYNLLTNPTSYFYAMANEGGEAVYNSLLAKATPTNV